MKTITPLFFCLIAFVCSCRDSDTDTNSSPTNERKDIVLTKVEQQVSTDHNNFAFDLFHQMYKDNVGHNLVFSPFGTFINLSMLANGAKYNTLTEIQNILGFSTSDYSMADVNSYCHTLISNLPTLDNISKCESAQSVWLKQNANFTAHFEEVNQDAYEAMIKSVDFSNSQTLDDINRWCKESTHGCIPEILSQISPNDYFYLLNAVYFKGAWKKTFDKADTKQEYFTSTQQQKDLVPMMNKEDNVRYAENACFFIAEFTYGNEAFSMVVFLPEEDKLLANCMSELTSQNWIIWEKEMETTKVKVKMPRMNICSDVDLIPYLKSLGMCDAFDKEKADFTDLTSSESIYLNLLRQKCDLIVDEEGSEAASVTIAGDAPTAMPAEKTLYLNRPFAFIIKENSTGVILFMGAFEEP